MPGHLPSLCNHSLPHMHNYLTNTGNVSLLLKALAKIKENLDGILLALHPSGTATFSTGSTYFMTDTLWLAEEIELDGPGDRSNTKPTAVPKNPFPKGDPCKKSLYYGDSNISSGIRRNSWVSLLIKSTKTPTPSADFLWILLADYFIKESPRSDTRRYGNDAKPSYRTTGHFLNFISISKVSENLGFLA